MISFLNPWFWLGALAVAAPIWLHLRRKRETRLVRFSALRFLEDQPTARRAPWRPHNLFLLALRLLALLLIVCGFAWPYLRTLNTVPIRESRVYILDNTLSHQANDGFERDRQRVAKELRRAGSDLQVAVVELASTPRVLVNFGQDRQAALDRIEELRPSFERGSYLAAFRQANALLANSFGEQKRIIFLTDNQANQWNENVNTPPFLRNVQIEVPPEEMTARPNVWVYEPRLQRIFLGDKSLVSFSVKLGHLGPAKRANLILRANGQTILNREVELEQQPQSIALQAQWEAEPSAWLRGEAVVEADPDVLPADNRVFFSLAPVLEGKVVLLAQSPYLRLALSPEIMRGQWATRLLEPTNLPEELAANRDGDVLCLESNSLQSSDARKLLWRYLTNGRGALLVVNRVTPAIDGCLRELGFEAEGTVTAEKDNPEKFQFVFANHAIFHPFLSPDFGSLMDIRISEYARLRARQAMPLIFSESGAGLFFQGTKFPGKLFVSAFGLDREHTTWPVHQTFIPFLDLALQAARAEDPTPTTFEPGQVCTVPLPGRQEGSELVLSGDNGERTSAIVEHGKAQFRMPGQPGLYALRREGSDRVEKMFSINPSPKESELTYSDSPQSLKAWRFSRPLLAGGPPAPAGQVKIRLAGVLQQHLWWWMLLAALAALMLETALAHRAKEVG